MFTDWPRILNTRLKPPLTGVAAPNRGTRRVRVSGQSDPHFVFLISCAATGAIAATAQSSIAPTASYENLMVSSPLVL